MKKLNKTGAHLLSNQMMSRILAPTQGWVDQSPRRVNGSLLKAPRRKERKPRLKKFNGK